MDQTYNRNGIDSHLGSTILITIPRKQGIEVCQAFKGQPSESFLL